MIKTSTPPDREITFTDVKTGISTVNYGARRRNAVNDNDFLARVRVDGDRPPYRRWESNAISSSALFVARIFARTKLRFEAKRLGSTPWTLCVRSPVCFADTVSVRLTENCYSKVLGSLGKTRRPKWYRPGEFLAVRLPTWRTDARRLLNETISYPRNPSTTIIEIGQRRFRRRRNKRKRRPFDSHDRAHVVIPDGWPIEIVAERCLRIIYRR